MPSISWPTASSGRQIGDSFIAVDLVQAGPGDIVLVMQERNGVRQILKQQRLPIRSIVIGIVDHVDLAPGA